MRPTTSPPASTSKSSSFHRPDDRLSAARLRTSWSISAPLPIGRAEHCNCTEGKKHRAKNVSIPRPGGDCAGQRQEGEQSEVARLGVHFRPRLEGAATRLPLPVRELMALNRNPHVPAAGRQAIFLGTTEPRAARPRKAPPRSDAKYAKASWRCPRIGKVRRHCGALRGRKQSQHDDCRDYRRHIACCAHQRPRQGGARQCALHPPRIVTAYVV